MAVRQIFPTFAAEFHEIRQTIGRWCNGNTTGFGSVIPGSNPSRPTPIPTLRYGLTVCSRAWNVLFQGVEHFVPRLGTFCSRGWKVLFHALEENGDVFTKEQFSGFWDENGQFIC